MLSFNDFIKEDCWQGYTQKGMKPKNGKMVPNCVPEDSQEEALSFQGRRALSRAMKRRKSQLKLAKKRAMQKTAGTDVLMKRAIKQARNQIFKKISKDVGRSDLTPQRRAEIEKKVKSMNNRVTALARKLLPQIRQASKNKRK